MGFRRLVSGYNGGHYLGQKIHFLMEMVYGMIVMRMDGKNKIASRRIRSISCN